MAPKLNVQRPVIIVLCSAAVGVAVISALAMYFRRRKRRKAKLYNDIEVPVVSVSQTSTKERIRNPSNNSSHSTERMNKNKSISNSTTISGSKSHSIPIKASTSKETYSIPHSSQHPSPTNTIKKCNSVASDLSDMNSTCTTVLANENVVVLSAPQLLEAGVDLILKARHQWELALQQLNRRGDVVDDDDDDDDDIIIGDDAVLKKNHQQRHCLEAQAQSQPEPLQYLQLAGPGSTFSVHDLSSSEAETANRLKHQLTQLLELADRMRSCCSNEMLSQLCAGVAMDAALSEMDRDYEERRKKYVSDDSSSEVESFYSAAETVDLSDLEEHIEQFQHLLLYEDALQQLHDGNVPYRILRTKQMGCTSDTEFLAKVHCIRQAFIEIFHVKENRDWYEELCRDLVGSLLKHADKDPLDFYRTFDTLMEYLKEPSNWVDIESELKERNEAVGCIDILFSLVTPHYCPYKKESKMSHQVKAMTFFDIVIDFLLFDAFDDLDNVPATIINVCANRWITNGFKETAILTFVWSVLKAKKAMLTNQNGFMSRFYNISEITSPVLSWGFLGPDGPLKDMCQFFKNEIVNFMTEVFSFDFARFTTLTELSEDVMKIARKHGQMAKERLAVHPSYWA